MYFCKYRKISCGKSVIKNGFSYPYRAGFRGKKLRNRDKGEIVKRKISLVVYTLIGAGVDKCCFFRIVKAIFIKTSRVAGAHKNSCYYNETGNLKNILKTEV